MPVGIRILNLMVAVSAQKNLSTPRAECRAPISGGSRRDGGIYSVNVEAGAAAEAPSGSAAEPGRGPAAAGAPR